MLLNIAKALRSLIIVINLKILIENMQDEVLEFILRKFKKDCNWLNGNCYYFALILKDRFPEGRIFYDVIIGHFVFIYKEKAYDWTGLCDSTEVLVDWENFDKYDDLLKRRIIRDCIL